MSFLTIRVKRLVRQKNIDLLHQLVGLGSISCVQASADLLPGSPAAVFLRMPELNCQSLSTWILNNTRRIA
jgi:hypothetical protein